MFRKKSKNIRKKINAEYGKSIEPNGIKYDSERKEKIAIFHKEMEQSGKKADVDEITWEDLEMDTIFQVVNRTYSYIGEQILYHRMHCILEEQELENLEQTISYFEQNSELRLAFSEKIYLIGKRLDSYQLPYLIINSRFWQIGNPVMIRILQILLMFLGSLSMITGHTLFLIGTILVGIINFAVYFTTKLKYEPLLESLKDFRVFLNFGNFIINYKDEILISNEIMEAAYELNKLGGKIYRINTRKHCVLTGDIQAILWDYIMGITLIDLVMYNKVVKEISKYQNQIMQLYDFAGTIDMAISIASYRASLPFYCKPKLSNKYSIRGKGIVHPLIPYGVPNDMTLNRRALITGANASGKSTFMKALSINVILAQSINTVNAQEFELPPMYVYSSMALRDDIMTGESYYVREAKRIREMLNIQSDQKATLIVIDEILKGTNTIERIAASIGILNHLSHQDYFIMVATHDLELISELSGKYDNYYFETNISENDIQFEYKIKKGIGGKSNAIALLALLDYPEEILKIAKQKVSHS